MFLGNNACPNKLINKYMDSEHVIHVYCVYVFEYWGSKTMVYKTDIK